MRRIWIIGTVAAVGAACTNSPPAELNFDSGPAVTVAETSTTLRSLTLDMGFRELDEAFRAMDEPARATITLTYVSEDDAASAVEVITSDPRAQWRHRSLTVGSGEPIEFVEHLDGDMILPVNTFLANELAAANLAETAAGGEQVSLSPTLMQMDGLVRVPVVVEPLGAVLSEVKNLSTAKNRFLPARIFADVAELRVVGHRNGAVEVELAPHEDELARYYVFRFDGDNRLVHIDGRLAGTDESVVVDISYEIDETLLVEPVEFLTEADLIERAGERSEWFVNQ